jgi:hypothetical protein
MTPHRLTRIVPPDGYTDHPSREDAEATLSSETGHPVARDARGRYVAPDGAVIALIKPAPITTGGARHGKHAHPRRQVTAPVETFAAQDEAAKRAGKTWSRWASDILSAAAPARRSGSM